MSRHILYIDPLEKLVFKKDSSLLLAHTLKSLGEEVYLLFEEDFSYRNDAWPRLSVWNFSSSLNESTLYLEAFEATSEETITLDPADIFHFRLDPPFDSRYLRILWMLRAFEDRGLRVVNSAKGLLLNNEKILAYEHPSALATLVTSDPTTFNKFAKKCRDQGNAALILKPLDLYQGIGVEKVDLENLEAASNTFKKKVSNLGGALVVQPFCEGVYQGELRSLYFAGKELGTIIKIPPKGQFLANIAQGASYHAVELSPVQKAACDEVALKLMDVGVPWVAFDILGDGLSEVNITCPGLLVEVSSAMKRNLAIDIIKAL